VAIATPERAATFQDSGKAAEECDQDIVNRGPCPGEQFRWVDKVKWRDKEIKQCGQHADHDHNKKVSETVYQEIPVVGTKRQADSHYWPHQGRDEHGADDDRGGIDVKANRRDDYRERKDPNIWPPEGDAAFDPLCGFLGVDLVINVEHTPKPSLENTVTHVVNIKIKS